MKPSQPGILATVRATQESIRCLDVRLQRGLTKVDEFLPPSLIFRSCRLADALNDRKVRGQVTIRATATYEKRQSRRRLYLQINPLPTTESLRRNASFTGPDLRRLAKMDAASPSKQCINYPIR